MEISEFRQKLHDYHKFMDPSTFINAFLDSSHQHQDNLELVLQDMEKAKLDYQARVSAYAEKIDAR